jgi:hypothetical protein
MKILKLSLKDRVLRAIKKRTIKDFIKTFNEKEIKVPYYVYFTTTTT